MGNPNGTKHLQVPCVSCIMAVLASRSVGCGRIYHMQGNEQGHANRDHYMTRVLMMQFKDLDRLRAKIPSRCNEATLQNKGNRFIACSSLPNHCFDDISKCLY